MTDAHSQGTTSNFGRQRQANVWDNHEKVWLCRHPTLLCIQAVRYGCRGKDISLIEPTHGTSAIGQRQTRKQAIRAIPRSHLEGKRSLCSIATKEGRPNNGPNIGSDGHVRWSEKFQNDRIFSSPADQVQCWVPFAGQMRENAAMHQKKTWFKCWNTFKKDDTADWTSGDLLRSQENGERDKCGSRTTR